MIFHSGYPAFTKNRTRRMQYRCDSFGIKIENFLNDMTWVSEKQRVLVGFKVIRLTVFPLQASFNLIYTQTENRLIREKKKGNQTSARVSVPRDRCFSMSFTFR